jgi:hypothetical protein
LECSFATSPSEHSCRNRRISTRPFKLSTPPPSYLQNTHHGARQAHPAADHRQSRPTNHNAGNNPIPTLHEGLIPTIAQAAPISSTTISEINEV